MKQAIPFHPVTLTRLCLIGCLTWGSGCRQRLPEPPETDAGPNVEGHTIAFPEQAPQMGALGVSTAEPARARTIRMTGRLVWNDDVTVRVFPPVSGRMGEISVNPGQRVSAGEVLAKMVSPEFGQAQAQARKALAELKLAERVLNRAKELYEHGAVAQKDLETAEVDYARAVLEQERSLATLAVYGGECDAEHSFCTLKAPLGGWVVEKSIGPGQEVRADQVGAEHPPLFVISDPSQLWLLLDVMESDLPEIKAGQRLEVRSRAYPGKNFAGQIEVIGDSMDPLTRTVKVRAGVENPEKLLKAEMLVTAEVALAPTTTPAAEVPARAIFLKSSRHFVFVEISPRRYERRPVHVGAERGGRILIQDGVAPGERVVTDGCLLLQAIIDGG